MTRRTWMASALLAPLPKKVRLGMIGLEGHISEILNPLKQLPELELVAVSDPNPNLMRRVGKGAKEYTDYRQMLDREKLDVVGVCGSNGIRANAIIACAEHKSHIAAEKPIGIERSDLDRVRKAVAANHVRLTMLLPMRFSPPYLALKRIVDSGAIGEVAQISAQKSYKLGERPEWMRKRATFGGTIPYIGIHMVDLMRWSSGREFLETASFQHRVGFPDLADMQNTTASIFRLDNGGTGCLHMDYLRPETAPTHGDDRLRLAGTKGVAEYQAATGVTVVTDREKPRQVTDLPPSRSLFIDFLDSVYNGKPAALTMEDIYRVNEIVFAARESAERGGMVKI